MDEKDHIIAAYKRMYDGMIAKDEKILRDVLDDSFVLVHMTGMRQPKEEFINIRLKILFIGFQRIHIQQLISFYTVYRQIMLQFTT